MKIGTASAEIAAAIIAFWTKFKERRSVRVGALAFALLTGLAAGAWYVVGVWKLTEERFEVANRNAAEWRSLYHTNETLARGQPPEPWSAGVFFHEEVLRDAARPLIGMKISTRLPAPINDRVELTLQSFEIQADIGLAIASASLALRIPSQDITLDVNVSGLILIRDIVSTRSGDYVANFQLVPTEVAPRLTFRNVMLGRRDFISDVVRLGVLRAFADQLVLSLPLPRELSANVAFRSTDQIRTEGGGSVTYDLEMVGGNLREPVHFDPPVFVRDGVWLLARLSDNGQRPFPAVAPPASSGIAEANQRLRESIANRYRPVPMPSSRVQIWLGAGAIQQLVTNFNDLPTDRRTVQARSTAVVGRLADKPWRDDLLGEGGAFVELDGPTSATAAAVVGPIAVQSAEDGVFTLRVPIAVTARVGVHLHVDPLVGGGAGTRVGLEGRAQDTIEGALRLRLVEYGDDAGLLLQPTLSCRAIDLEIRTDGRLALDAGWIRVPSVGVRTQQLVGRDPPAPSIVLSSLPNMFSLPAGEHRVGDLSLVVEPATAAAAIRIVPRTVEASSRGFRIGADFVLTNAPTAELEEPERDRHATVLQRMRETLSNGQRPQCPEVGAARVLIGDIEVGPNNEVVKYVQGLINAGRQISDQLRRIAERPGDAISSASDNVKNELNQGLQNLGLPFRF